MIKTIRAYDVETVSGVAKFIRAYSDIHDMTHDHRVNARDAILDFKNAVIKAGLTLAEKAAVVKVYSTGIKLHGAEKRAFFDACAKIADVFKAEGYGAMEITKFTY